MKLGSSRRGLRGGIAALAAGALALGGIIATPLAATAAEVNVTGVTFDWGINNESSGGSYFGVCNFLSAGVAGNTGSSRVWSEGDGFFKGQDGNVSITKPAANDGTGSQAVTWANKCRKPDGTALTQPTTNNPGSYTQSRVQIAGGTGTVDRAAGTAQIDWTGSFSVVYYGGMTYWSVTNPKLTVTADGKGTVTGLVSGYGADMDNPDVWSKLADQPDMVLANLTGVQVTDTGITVTPDYLGVAVPEDVNGRNPAVTDQSWSGAFPEEFLRFQQLTGQSSYWYTTAGGENSIQPRKQTLPLKVSYALPAAAIITAQPATQTVALGDNATFTVAATGATGYQWQSAATGSDAFANIEGATNASLQVAGTSANAKQYRVVVSGAGGNATSDAVALTVNVPTPTVTVSKTSGINPAGETVTVTGTGFLPNGTATNGARAPLSGKFGGAYIAFASLSGSSYTNKGSQNPDYTKWGVHAADRNTVGESASITIAADGTFTAQLTVVDGVAPGNGTWGIRTYAGSGAVYPAFSTFTPIAFAAPDAAVITTQPTAQSVPAGAQATFSVVATDATGYQWQSSTNGTDWADISGATSASYALTATATAAQSTYRVVVSGAGGNATSDAVSLTAQQPTVVIPEIPRAGGTVTVTGSGFLPAEPGIYLGLGPAGLPGFYMGSAQLVPGQMVIIAPMYEAGEIEAGRTAKLQADGTFSVDITVPAWSAATPAYATYTSKAHGQGFMDPSQNTISAATYQVTAPSAPAAPVAALGSSDTSIDLTWTAPVDNGGSAVTGYDVIVTPASGTAQTVSVGDVLSATVPGLTRGQSYTATIVAKNAVGSSAASAASNAVAVPAIAPAAPAAPVVTAAGTTSLNASWVAPAANGSAITGYSVVVSQGGSVVRTIPVSGTTTTITGLDVATSYTITVAAINGAGTSAASAATSATTLAERPATIPAPTVAAGSGTTLDVQWTEPADGGSPITGYVLKVSAGGSVVKTVQVGVVTSATVAGLTPGTSYTVTVAAKNAQGTGVASPASAAARTFAVPTAPVVTATAAGTSVTATWAAPADNGAVVTDYTAQLRSGGTVVQTISTDDLTATFGNLTPGGVYTVSVVATNSVGASAAGVSGSVTVPAVAPSAPSSPVATPGADGTSLTVTWGAPLSDGGSAITGYQAAISQVDAAGQPVGETTVVELGPDARSHTFTGLAAGSYVTAVLAVNDAGNARSDILTATIAGPAPAADPVSVPDSALVGESGGDAKIEVGDGVAKIFVGTEYANTWVGVTVHSDPIFVGWFLVDAAGYVTAPLPAGLPEGTHHVVVQDAAGDVLGYQAFAVDSSVTPGGDTPGTDPSGEGQATAGGSLAATGQNGDALGWTVFAALMLIAAGAVVFATRRKVDA